MSTGAVIGLHVYTTYLKSSIILNPPTLLCLTCFLSSPFRVILYFLFTQHFMHFSVWELTNITALLVYFFHSYNQHFLLTGTILGVRATPLLKSVSCLEEPMGWGEVESLDYTPERKVAWVQFIVEQFCDLSKIHKSLRAWMPSLVKWSSWKELWELKGFTNVWDRTWHLQIKDGFLHLFMISAQQYSWNTGFISIYTCKWTKCCGFTHKKFSYNEGQILDPQHHLVEGY